MKPGDILRVKISGETVIVIEAGAEKDKTIVKAKRAGVSHSNGISFYNTEPFHDFELEPVEANIDREFREAVYRSQLAQRGLGLSRAQSAESDQGELFDDDEPEDPEGGPLN